MPGMTQEGLILRMAISEAINFEFDNRSLKEGAERRGDGGGNTKKKSKIL